jgi:archaellum component FlaF (FlaF/FlaG flagellin family)
MAVKRDAQKAARPLPLRYGYKMKLLSTITLLFLASTASAVPFKGATLNEKEIRQLYNSQCNEFMVYSYSAKSAMPKKLVEILNQGEKLITAKVLSCTLKGTVFEFYLENQNGEWVMFDAESITIRSRKGPR